jgi:transposase-like protein
MLNQIIVALGIPRSESGSKRLGIRMSKRIRLHMALADAQDNFDKDCKFIAVKIVKLLRVVNTVIQKQNSVKILLISDGKRVNSTIIGKMDQKSLRRVIERKIDPGHRIKTDCYDTYNVLRNYSSGRPISEFLPELFCDKNSVANANHGFMQYVNLSFHDQFRGVNLENAWLYLKEYEYRFNRRCRSADSFADIISYFPEFNSVNLLQVRADGYAVL